MQETWVWSLGWKDPLEKGKATHSSILAWRIPWTVEFMGLQRVGYDWANFTFFQPSLKTLSSIWQVYSRYIRIGTAWRACYTGWTQVAGPTLRVPDSAVLQWAGNLYFWSDLGWYWSCQSRNTLRTIALKNFSFVFLHALLYSNTCASTSQF